jgi:hypothetical protein
MKQNKKTLPQTPILPPEVHPEQSLALLHTLHLLTRDGKLNQDARRKLKQVYHLYQMIEKELQPLYTEYSEVTLVDHGAGKSYLGFIVYDLFFKRLSSGHIYGIETRAALVESSRALAAQLQFARMTFLHLTVAESLVCATLPERVHMVTALHACDTATDDAIEFALQKQAQVVLLVPCCQAELARVLRQSKALQLAKTPLSELWRHPLHTRELGSHLTNVLRCLYLEACGYSVSVTELVGWEHSMKNELILARYTGHKKRAAANRMRAIVEEFGLSEWLPLRYPRLAQME